MKVLYICSGIVLLFCICEAKVAKHGAQEKMNKDGERNEHFDHEKFLGELNVI